MKAGEVVKIRRAGGNWIEAEVLLASGNDMSLALAVDEGLPIPFMLHPELGCQVLLLMKDEHGYGEVPPTTRYWEIKRTGIIKRNGRAQALRDSGNTGSDSGDSISRP